jgi:hypothetical protein
MMNNVPPVDIDIILDPFLLNIFPRSLLPTAGYVIVVAAASFLVAKLLVSWIRAIVMSDDKGKQKKEQ